MKTSRKSKQRIVTHDGIGVKGFIASMIDGEPRLIEGSDDSIQSTVTAMIKKIVSSTQEFSQITARAKTGWIVTMKKERP